jgi:hypothetical protein
VTDATSSGSRLPTIFVSYSHEDAPFVLDLVQRLRMRGVNVWIDQVELVVGDSLIERIGDAIHGGDFVLAVISPHSINSPWCQKELRLAATRGISENRVFVLPVRHGVVAMPSFLTDALYARSDDPARLADEVARAVTDHLERMRSAGILPPSMGDIISAEEGFLRAMGIEGLEGAAKRFVYETFMSEVFDRAGERAFDEMDEAQLEALDTLTVDTEPDEIELMHWLRTNVPNFGALWQEEAAGLGAEYREFAERDTADPQAWAKQIAEQARLRRERMDQWYESG